MKTPLEYLKKNLPEFGLAAVCWEWGGTKATNGYGRACFDSQRYQAHRFAYSILVGEIPAGMQLCHHCDNRLCCNPVHLFIGTAQDNALDASKKKRLHAHTSPETMPRGSKHGQSKLSDEQVLEIRRLYSTAPRINGGHWGMKELAARYGVDATTIHRAARGVSWSHLPTGSAAKR